MKSSLLLAAALLLACTLPVQAQTSRTPKDEWCIQKATDENNNLVFITANLGYRNYGYKAEFPWCLSVNMTILDTNLNGHPTSEEAPVLDATEDVITAALEKTGPTHFIGRTTVSGFRKLFFFVADAEKANAALLLLSKMPQTRLWEYRMEKDEKWLRVEPFFAKGARCL